MTEIKMSNEGIYALVIKGLLIIISVWIFGILLYSFVQNAFGLQGSNDNGDVIPMDFSMSLIIAVIICFATGKILQAILSVETREKDILIRAGLIFPKESKIQYSELKEARPSPTFLEFIDGFFGVSTISIEDSKVIVISGVKKPIELVREINDRIAANKRKGLTIEDLAKELKSLRDDLESLKGSINTKKAKETKKEEEAPKGRGKFGLGPLEEGV